MEHQIIVLIDAELRIIRLFGKVNRTIPFANAFILPSLISGEEVLYVSALESVMGEDVINVLTYMITEEDQPTEKLFIRSTQEGYVRVSELKLVFAGPKDAKPVENYGWDLFDRSPTLRKLLLDDKVQIITESEAKSLRKCRPGAKAKDASLDSILLKGSVKDIMEREDMFGPDGGNGDEIDVDENTEVLTENQIIQRQFKFGKDAKKEEPNA